MVAGFGASRPYTPRTTPQPTRLIKEPDDLEAQFDALVDALRRDVRRTRQQVEKFSRAYQRMAEAQSGGTVESDLDEKTQRAYRRLKQLQLVAQHIESSVSYLLGSGIEPEPTATARRSTSRSASWRASKRNASACTVMCTTVPRRS